MRLFAITTLMAGLTGCTFASGALLGGFIWGESPMAPNAMF
ncbi:MAG TPA: hypothetical protein QGF58_03540 [Myxococcota bacterium]|nr:hypothetical protein [Myxococcota bacterium]